MKTTKTFEIEIERHNVTPAQFLAYLRSMQKKHPEMANDFDLRMFTAESWSVDYCNALPSEKPCESERVTDKPYEKQTYIRHHDGTTYNEIIEFQFDDDKTGFGYYYTVQIDVADEDREANTAENVAAIIRRRAEQADRQEAKAEKIEAEAEQADREGYTAKWWIDSKRTEAAKLRREAAETRAAIEATQEAQEAPQEAPAAEAEQQPTETENAPQAATQAAQDAATEPAPVGVWMDDGSATDSQTAREMILQNLEYLAADDPARAEQIELLTELDRQEGRQHTDPDAVTLAPADAACVWDEDGNTPFEPAEAAQHAATVAGIIRRKGGYRERDIINHPHTVERGTWTTEHKVVEILSTTPDADGYRAGCAVDIVTRAIVG